MSGDVQVKLRQPASLSDPRFLGGNTNDPAAIPRAQNVEIPVIPATYWGELSWREPGARRSRLSCTSGRGLLPRSARAEAMLASPPLVRSSVYTVPFDEHPVRVPRTVMRRWTWSCSSMRAAGRGA